VQQFRNVF
jgi:hypothetical protein